LRCAYIFRSVACDAAALGVQSPSIHVDSTSSVSVSSPCSVATDCAIGDSDCAAICDCHPATRAPLRSVVPDCAGDEIDHAPSDGDTTTSCCSTTAVATAGCIFSVRDGQTVKQDRAHQDPDHPTRGFTIENRLPRILCTNGDILADAKHKSCRADASVRAIKKHELISRRSGSQRYLQGSQARMDQMLSGCKRR